jgi:hypothetical protein
VCRIHQDRTSTQAWLQDSQKQAAELAKKLVEEEKQQQQAQQQQQQQQQQQPAAGLATEPVRLSQTKNHHGSHSEPAAGFSAHSTSGGSSATGLNGSSATGLKEALERLRRNQEHIAQLAVDQL